MNKVAFRYNIRSDLPPRPEDPAVLGPRFLNTLDALSRTDPNVFHNSEIMSYPAAASLPIETARPRIASIIEKAACRNDLREPQPQYGYRAGALLINVDKSRNISLQISTAGSNLSTIPSDQKCYLCLQLNRNLCVQFGPAWGWRREWDSNPRYGFPYTRFPSVRLQPLGHPSGKRNRRNITSPPPLTTRTELPWFSPLRRHQF